MNARQTPVTLDQGAQLGEWTVRHLGFSNPDLEVVFEIERARDGATLALQLAGGTALVRAEVGVVSYRSFSGIPATLAAKVARQISHLFDTGALIFGQSFPHLVIETALTRGEDGRAALLGADGSEPRFLPGTLAGPSGALAEPREVLRLTPPGIAEFLEPELVLDGPPFAGYVFRAVLVPAVVGSSGSGVTSYLLEFELSDQRGAPRLCVPLGPAEPEVDRSYRCGDLRIGPTREGNSHEVSSAAERLFSHLVALLRLKHGAGLKVEAPPREAGDRRSLLKVVTPSREAGDHWGEARVETEGADQEFNIAIEADCGQACAFCSLKMVAPPNDGGAREFEKLRSQLDVARARGIRRVRLNGTDPLYFSHVLGLVGHARALGFERMTVFSTGRRFADPSFRREFMALAPDDLVVSLPLYGVTAAVHDAVTGRAGTHAEIMAALEGFRAERPGVTVEISTVIVRQNVAELVPMLRFAAERALRLSWQLPFPIRQTSRDPYSEVALRESDVASQVARAVASADVATVHLAADALANSLQHPCVLWRLRRDAGLPALDLALAQPLRPLKGTEYRTSKFAHGDQAAADPHVFAVATVPCPQAHACALAAACPQEHYFVYAEIFGLEEFQPVTPRDLYTVGRAAVHPAGRIGVKLRSSVALARLRLRESSGSGTAAPWTLRVGSRATGR